MELQGIFSVLPTPFDPGGQVNANEVAAVVDFAIACGAHGVVFPGVASEFDFLTTEERQDTLRLVAEAVAGRVPLIVGATGDTTDAVTGFAELGAEVGAAAAMVMAPAAVGNTASLVTSFFEEVAARAPLPILLQNAPPPVGAGLSVKTIGSVARQIPNVRYVKEETPPTGQRLSGLLDGAASSLVGVFGGAGARYAIDELNRGALGLMPAVELTDIHVAMYEAHRTGEHERARDLYARSLPLLLIQAIFRMRLTKEVLVRRGVIRNTEVRAPLPTFDAQDLREIDICLRDLEDLLIDAPAAQPTVVG